MIDSFSSGVEFTGSVGSFSWVVPRGRLADGLSWVVHCGRSVLALESVVQLPGSVGPFQLGCSAHALEAVIELDQSLRSCSFQAQLNHAFRLFSLRTQFGRSVGSF